MEYSLEDKIEALKNMLDYNEKYIQKLPSHITNMCNIKQIIGVRFESIKKFLLLFITFTIIFFSCFDSFLNILKYF